MKSGRSKTEEAKLVMVMAISRGNGGGFDTVVW
jgi:hypothetical protein